jgi:hypothetical protein
MSPLFRLGGERLEQLEAEERAPNVLKFTRDKAIRRREAKRFAEWYRNILIRILAA